MFVDNRPVWSDTWLAWHHELYVNPVFCKRWSARARGPLAPGACWMAVA